MSGGIAGLGGAEQVLGVYKAFYDNFSPGYGFDGIAVAMLANNSPIGVILAAFLFGALSGGSAVLQMMTGVSKYLVQVLQFIIVLILAAQFSWNWMRRTPQRPGTGVARRQAPEARGRRAGQGLRDARWARAAPTPPSWKSPSRRSASRRR